MRAAALSLFFLVCLAGCAPGFIYTDVITPLTSNFQATKVAQKSGAVRTQEVRLPAGRVNLTGAWSSRAIADAAKSGGLKSLYYADLRTVSVLGGLWRRRTAIVYGE